MAWYHVGSCDCPVGCCDCGTPSVPTKYTEDELNAQNKFVYLFINKEHSYCEEFIAGFPEKLKKNPYHGSWRYRFLGEL